jgi:hypothetical protein
MKPKFPKSRSVTRLLLAAVLLTLAVSAQDPSRTFRLQGRLNSAANAPVNGLVQVQFTIYDALTGGTALWSETKTVNVTGGLFAADLGSNVVLPENIFPDASTARFIGIKVGNDADDDAASPCRRRCDRESREVRR